MAYDETGKWILVEEEWLEFARASERLYAMTQNELHLNKEV